MKKVLVIFVLIFFSFGYVLADNNTSGLIYLQTEPTATLNETAKITGIFENAKNTSVFVKMSIEVYYEGNMLAVMNSDELESLPLSETNLTIYFTPQFLGVYQMKAHAVYDKRVSQTLETEIIVIDPNMVPMATTEIVFALIGICILVVALQIGLKRYMSKNGDKQGKLV